MNSDGDKLYTKLVDFDEIYNFVVQSFFIWSHLGDQKIDIMGHDGCSATVPNRRGPWRFANTAMDHDGGRLVLLNFETMI
jgi:hypothetical protein